MGLFYSSCQAEVQESRISIAIEELMNKSSNRLDVIRNSTDSLSEINKHLDNERQKTKDEKTQGEKLLTDIHNFKQKEIENQKIKQLQSELEMLKAENQKLNNDKTKPKIIEIEKEKVIVKEVKKEKIIDLKKSKEEKYQKEITELKNKLAKLETKHTELAEKHNELIEETSIHEQELVEVDFKKQKPKKQNKLPEPINKPTVVELDEPLDTFIAKEIEIAEIEETKQLEEPEEDQEEKIAFLSEESQKYQKVGEKVLNKNFDDTKYLSIIETAYKSLEEDNWIVAQKNMKQIITFFFEEQAKFPRLEAVEIYMGVARAFLDFCVASIELDKGYDADFHKAQQVFIESSEFLFNSAGLIKNTENDNYKNLRAIIDRTLAYIDEELVYIESVIGKKH